MKKYLPLIIVGIVILILVIFLFKFFSKPKSTESGVFEETTTSFSKSVSELSEDKQPNVEIRKRNDGKALIVTFSNLKNFSSLQYELSYLTKDEIPQGVIGSPVTLTGEDSIEKELLLGTCSGTVTLKCRYDEDVHQISLSIKYVDQNGDTYDQTVEYSL